MFTAAATRSLTDPREFGADTVAPTATLLAQGFTHAAIKAQLAAHRWQRIGRAVVRHNHELNRAEQRDVALITCGPRSVFTSFTAVELCGLTGWSRDPIHVLVPSSARTRSVPSFTLRTHFSAVWPPPLAGARVHRLGAAVVRAAASFERPRPGCGLLAACVQQRLLRPDHLLAALEGMPKVRHHATLVAAGHDIAQGSQALSEIDFLQLCRRAHLPLPLRQSVRAQKDGKRRYLDAEWRGPDGRRIVVEVDGALHMVATSWWADSLRQNELVISGDTVLRYPSVIIRCEADVVVNQLRRILPPGR